MKTRAAVLWELGGKWEVEEVDLDPPQAGEVLVKLTASGLCHSDEHLVTGDLPFPLPVVGGHEGAGVVVEVGVTQHRIDGAASGIVRRSESARDEEGALALPEIIAGRLARHLGIPEDAEHVVPQLETAAPRTRRGPA